MKKSTAINLGLRLQHIYMLTFGITLILFTLIVIAISGFLNLMSVTDESQIQSKVIAENAAPSLLFRDKKVANDLLNTLRNAPQVLSAAIYDEQGQIFAQYNVPGNQPPLKMKASSQGIEQSIEQGIGHINLTRTISHQGKALGSLYLHISLSTLYTLLFWQVLSTMLATVIALFVGKVFLEHLIASLLHPLATFTDVISKVSEQSDYKLRMHHDTPADTIVELNILAQGFNHMLEQIQSRDEQLEDTVITRTLELQKAKDEAESVSSQLKLTTKELIETQSQLVQSAKLASVGEMATGVAHELNQPLGIIAMTAELRLNEVKKNNYNKVQETLELIREQIERGTVIINHLRTFGRQSTSTPQLLNDINRIIEDAFIMLNQQFRLNDIEIEKKLAANLPPVRCNIIQIQQVLTNLLINARDALAEAKISTKKITVSSSVVNDHVLISIEDNGIGIAPEHLSRIFDPFFTTKEVGKGTGLGLSISYALIEEHQGTLSATSEVGVGTVFQMSLSTAELPKIPSH